MTGYVSPCPIPATITTTPRALPCLTLWSSRYMNIGLVLRSVSSHLFTSLQFVLHFSLSLFRSPHLVALVTLLSLSCCHPSSCSLMSNDNATTIPCTHIFLIYWRHLSLLVWLKYGVRDQNGGGKRSGGVFLTNRLTYSNSKTVLVTWL